MSALNHYEWELQRSFVEDEALFCAMEAGDGGAHVFPVEVRVHRRFYDHRLTPHYSLQKQDCFFITPSVLESGRVGAGKRYFRGVLSAMDVPAHEATIANIVGLAQAMSAGGALARIGAAVPMMVLCFVGEDEQARAITRAIAESTQFKGVPASRSAVEGLEKIKIGDASTSTSTCTICFEEFGWGCEAVRMPCSHLFHTDCIVRWLRSSNTCPVCRFHLKTSEISAFHSIN